MKKLVLLTTMFLASVTYSQVGINTTTPTNTLDVNGDARIRSLPTLTSPTVSPVFSDENGVLGKVNLSPQSQIAFYTSTSSFPISASNYNTGAIQTVPIVSSHAVLNTIGSTIGTTGNIKINQTGIYMLSASLNSQLTMNSGSDGYAYMAINLDISTDNGVSWTSVSGGRPLFPRVGYNDVNYNFTLPSVIQQLTSGNIIRLKFYRTSTAVNLQGESMSSISLGSSYGTPSYTLGITKL